jgi:biopolymer transport protein ExbD
MPLKLNQEEAPTINLTSMIDILFLLIIFFMVGTRFTENESNIQINLPKVAPNGAMLTSPSSKIVFIKPDGSIQLDGQVVSAEELTARLAQAVRNYPDTSVEIKPDGNVTMQQAANAISAVRSSGAQTNGITFASNQNLSSRR